MIRKKITIPEPSPEYAWFLGATAGDGSTTYADNTPNGVIKLAVTSSEFAEKFAQTGENLFDIEAKRNIKLLSKVNPKWKDVHEVRLHSVELTDFLGDLRASIWHKTMRERFSWIYDKGKNEWGFLQGYFDAEGSITDPQIVEKAYWRNGRNNHKARIAIAYPGPASHLCYGILLKDLQIWSTIENSKNRESGVKGITIANSRDILKFSRNVHSCIPEKERRLALYRKAKTGSRNLYSSSISF